MPFCYFRLLLTCFFSIHVFFMGFLTFDMAMKNNLTGSLLHQKLQRAYPQGMFPETTLDVLAKHPENTDIDAKELTANERDVFIDLATCALIESKRSPIYKAGIFAGFKQSYRYRADLNYTEVKYIFELNILFGLFTFRYTAK